MGGEGWVAFAPFAHPLPVMPLAYVNNKFNLTYEYLRKF